MSLESDRLAIREARASGATVASLAKVYALPRLLVRSWTSDIVIPSEREARRLARATAWQRHQ